MATVLSLRRAMLGSTNPLIAPTRSSAEGLVDWNRHLSVNGKPAAYVGNACSTCGFFFELADGAVDAEALGVLRQALAEGLDDIDDAIAGPFGALLPRGEYLVALLECTPMRVEPGGDGDYFREEQSALEETDPDGDEYTGPYIPNSHYYRLAGRTGFATGPGWYGESGFGFEFVVPFVQPIDPATSASYAARIDVGARPTAVSFALLDVKQPYERDSHWCMAHYLLDGHHKVDAAARLGRPITLLAFVPLEGGFCDEEKLTTFFSTYEQAASAVPPAG